MFSKGFTAFVALSLFSLSNEALGRERWLERDNKPVLLHPRRFGQENPAVLAQLSSACEGQVCGVLAGSAVSTLLGAADECAQQNLADQIIDAAAQFDATTQANMIALAIEFRQAEKNTPPDFTTNPPTNRNSVFCQTAPKNSQLNGLVQAQDPANDPNVFFDPATGASVTLGSQANTFPFGSAGSAAFSNSSVKRAASASNIGDFGSCSVPQIQFGTGFDGRKETSFEPVDQTSFNHGSAQNIDIITQFICDTLTNTCGADQTAKDTCATATAAADTVTAKTGGQADAFNAVFGITTDFAAIAEVDDQGNVVAGTGSSASSAATSASASVPAATASAASAAAPAASAASSIGDFGSCSVPQIQFGTGFDNRKETSFEPVDQTSFNHGSAQNIDIITQFICDTLTNTCGADQTAKDTCATAQAAADTVTAKTGGQADAFNAVFGITTDFAAIPEVDDQGNVVAGTGSAASSAAADPAAATTAASASSAAADLAAATTAASAAAPAASASSSIGDFGSCSVPQIQFGTGFDNRKETSFEPVDQTSFNHGSAQNIDIITQFICDTLTNTCGADQIAKDTCATAQAAADTVTAKTGGQADAFNAVFGITTDFAAIAEVDDQGNVVAGTGSASAASDASSSVAAQTVATSAAAATPSAAAAASGGNLQTFTGALGGVTPPAVTALGNGQFQVDGNAAFNSLQNALARSCDVQHNQCANAANASGNQGDLTVAACGDQQTQCDALAQ
ncbi:hypothetical protein M0805_002349 [Coniferiporia weirii]|nr:hypothetical protein M0805_002349 [Coniferiporia weirii]